MPTATSTAVPIRILNRLRLSMLDVINASRAEYDLQPLGLSMNPVAQRHAEDLMKHFALSHTGSDGSDLRTRWERSSGGRFGHLGENVYREGFCPKSRNYITLTLDQMVRRAHDSLMISPRHRANLLNPLYQTILIGLAIDTPNMWVVQVLSSRW